jgi:FAD/FMN-containing dehydrogenase
MSKVAQLLRQYVDGEVLTDNETLDYFSTDGSVFEVMPKLAVYPLNTTDVRKAVRFAWQLAEKGKVLPITARGSGTDQAGAALGDGMVLAFPAHMNKLLEINKDTVTVQPGENYGALQKVLKTHGRFLPPYPSSIDYSTIGGAVANNAAGELTLKYGATREFVESLQVVLANGELITTRRLSKRELNKKMGETSFEAEIYRQLDALIADNQDLVDQTVPNVSKNSAGYALSMVKDKKGGMDLTPLFVGSQGTLGLVTEVTMKTEEYTPQNSLIAAYFDSIESAGEAVDQLHELGPAALEFVDKHLLDMVNDSSPNQLKGLIDQPYPKFVLLIEFDEHSASKRRRRVKKAKKILNEKATEYQITDDEHEQELLWKLRRSAAAVVSRSKGKTKALPIIEDGVVPKDRFVEFINRVYEIYDKYGLDVALWGHAGDGNIHMQPFLDLSSTSDRQLVFKIMDDYYNLAIELGGSTSGEHNDGRLRAPYLKKLFGEDVYHLFAKTKDIFDPYGMLNPGVKIGVQKSDLPSMLRKSYSMAHLSDKLPRTHR